MAQLDKIKVANALALSSAILWILCSLFVWLLPQLSLAITSWWMHGMSLQAMGGWRLNGVNFVLGGASLAVAAWVSGYVFAWVWEKLGK